MILEGLVCTTSTTVATSKITLTIPARRNQRVYLVTAAYSTDLQGAFDCQDNTTSVFQVPTEARATSFQSPAFTPGYPIPVSSTGVAANFVLNVTTTGRLSVCYGYGI